jgi:hypothetical protein
VETPYKVGDRVEGLETEINGNMLVKANGTRIPRYYAIVHDENGGVKWSADLRGDKLAGMESNLHMMVRIWGTYQLERTNPVIIVDRYERVNPAEKIAVWQGKVEGGSVAGKNAYVLTTADGTKYILQTSLHLPPEAFADQSRNPTDLTTVEGVLLSDKLDGYPIIRDVMTMNGRLQGDTQPQSTQMMEIGPDESITDMISGQVNITGARLVYLSMDFASGHLPENHPARTLQPLWEFSGKLQDGRTVSLFVQAVEEKYLK